MWIFDSVLLFFRFKSFAPWPKYVGIMFVLLLVVDCFLGLITEECYGLFELETSYWGLEDHAPQLFP